MADWREVDIKFWPAAGTPSAPVAAAVTPPPAQSGIWGGDKFHGGFGPTQIFDLDYWTLRMRSGQLFRSNLYARGLLRRLVTNEINTGLTLEAQPEELILGMPEDSLADWSELVENRFAIWANNASLCDYKGKSTFGELQRQARLEALISGDVLVMLDISRVTGLPRMRLVSGSKVRTPLDPGKLRADHRIEHGVELDAADRQVAYWVEQADGKPPKRVPAVGPRSGRRVAWLMYGTERRLDDVRGEPMLAIILQSLKEIDRYRDAATRKATLNSIIAWFIEKTEDKPGTLPGLGGAIRRDDATPNDSVNTDRTFPITEYLPGTVIQELQTGEKPVPYSTAGTDVNFGPFEESMIQAIAWACEIPPEILRLAFSNNYSASQAAINEFKMYLNLRRTEMGENLCQPTYIEWLISEVLARKITAAGLLEAWRNPRQYDIFGAWIASDWSGAIKPSTDIVKQGKGIKLLIDEGLMTRARAAREATGMKYSKVVRRLRLENEALKDAREALGGVEENGTIGGEGEPAEVAVLREIIGGAVEEAVNDDR